VQKDGTHVSTVGQGRVQQNSVDTLVTTMAPTNNQRTTARAARVPGARLRTPKP